MTDLSNSLADLAERVRIANEAVIVAQRTTAEKAVEAGRLLCQAKEECPHGDWAPFLERAGIRDRQARRLMQIARSGLEIGHVSEMGIKGTLEYLAKCKLPDPGYCLLISKNGWEDADDRPPLVLVSPSPDYAGYFDVSLIDMGRDQFVESSRPVLGESMRGPDGAFFNGLWKAVDAMLDIPHEERSFSIVPAALLADDDCDFLDDIPLPDPATGEGMSMADHPLPKSYRLAKEALLACINDFTVERYGKAMEAVQTASVMFERWPNDPRMIGTFAKIANDEEFTQMSSLVTVMAKDRLPRGRAA